VISFVADRAVCNDMNNVAWNLVFLCKLWYFEISSGLTTTLVFERPQKRKFRWKNIRRKMMPVKNPRSRLSKNWSIVPTLITVPRQVSVQHLKVWKWHCVYLIKCWKWHFECFFDTFECDLIKALKNGISKTHQDK
jgi:hypothetical protein